MHIQIKNCNNIDLGNIELKETVLNVKYAINGTGKSTLAKALVASANDRKNNSKTILELKPFKYKNSREDDPNITGNEQIVTTKIFDEKFINEFVFQADEVLKGSFDIFIRDEKYVKGMEEIDALVTEIKLSLIDDAEIKELVQDFAAISASFGNKADGGIHGSSNLAKAFKNGNKVANIPAELQSYKNFIQHTDNFSWVKWQLAGKNFLEISHECPYCTNDIQEKKETIKKVADVYDSGAVEKLSKLIETFSRLKEYFSDEARSNIDEFISNVSSYTQEQENYLKEIKQQIDLLHKKFLDAQNLGFTTLKDVQKVITKLNEHRIDLNFYVHLKSEKTLGKVAIVNTAIDGLLSKANDLRQKIAKQNSLISSLVDAHGNAINAFLANAGYRYTVSLETDQDDQIKLKLRHVDIQNEVSNARSHLSFGERNAFALVMFMYDALKQNPDLIILDDPISSFDKNKKYAIIEMLFKKGNSFNGKTVLLLTHDFDPLVDILLHHPDRFSTPYASFLENRNGILTEKEIKRNNIKTFLEICKSNIGSNSEILTRLVYLRRYLEIENLKGLDWDIVSSLFHKRHAPTKLGLDSTDGQQKQIAMNPAEIENGNQLIRRHIEEFEYSTVFNTINDKDKLKYLYQNCSNNYEKLHIYRILFDENLVANHSTVIRKFINEAFHIENNYIYQLDPKDYQIVPYFVTDECDSFVSTI